MKRDRKPLACIVLAAGQGKRMNSALPKALHNLAGRPMIGWLLETLAALAPEKIVVVASPEGADVIAAAVRPHAVAIQPSPLGTADAVRAGLALLPGFAGDVLILLGDMPLIGAATLNALIDARYKDGKTGISVLGVEYDPPPAFGRLVMGDDGALARIVEDRDCTPDERALTLCNTGAFCVDGLKLPDWLAAVGRDNAQNEFYVTDLPAIAAGEGVRTHVLVTRAPDEVRGVNNRADLAALESIVQKRLRAEAMAAGATLTDPDHVYFSWDTVVGRDVSIEPGVFFGPGVSVADGATIRAFSHLEGAAVGPGAVIGPFARLRPGAVIGAAGRIGNFVEIKNAHLGEGVKAGHLAYIGDADVGDEVNFSCGAITVNYDGINKHRTTIGAGAMIGSNVNLVAPVSIGAGAYIGAGSTIAGDVPPDALAVARQKPVIKEGWAAARREDKKKPV